MAGERTIGLRYLRIQPLRSVAWLLAVVIIVATGSGAARAQAPDGRIIVIDLPWFGQIADMDARRQSMSDLLADIGMFHDEAPAGMGTVVLAPRGPNIRVIADTTDGSETTAELQTSREYLRAEAGHGGPYSAMTVQDVRESVYTALRRLGFRRTGRPRVLDLHVFAAEWRLDRNDAYGDLMATEQATSCILERSTVAEVWPDHVALRVEFRIPEGARAPSASAEAALIGVLTGYSTEVPHVATRGAAGPRCGIGAAQTAVGYIDPGMVDNPDCSRPPAPLGTLGATVQACRSAAPLAPAVGDRLDRLPVLAVVRPAAPAMRAPDLQGSLLGATAPLARIGSVEIRPGAPPPTGPVQAPAAARIELRPGPSCSPGESGDLVLGQGVDTVTVVVSRYACDAAEVPLGEVGLR